jgi:UDP-2,3-diacylglucosamine hydrolase
LPQSIYFLSDAHLGHGDPKTERKKEDALISFLRGLHGEAEALYLVGDLFDFWFEYRSVVPRKHARVLFEIYRLVVAGVRVVYVAGNHDFWMGPYLSEQVGVELSFTPVEARHQGVLMHIAHGDGLSSRDAGYRLLRGVLRSPVCIASFRTIHPDLGAFLAKLASRSSRWGEERAHRPFRLDQGYLSAARDKFAQGFDAVIFGHVHRPVHRTEPKTLIVLGDWMKHFSYAVLEDGKFELRTWGEPGRASRGVIPRDGS